MARFDVYRMVSGTVVVDCQADLLSYLKTRLVVPLMPPQLEAPTTPKLNPAFVIDDAQYVLYPQFAGSAPVADLDRKIASLVSHELEILAALDMLISGY